MSRTSTSSATRASRPSRWPTTTTASRRRHRARRPRGPRAGACTPILGSLELGRINIAARAVGVGRAAFDAAMTLRPASGRPSACPSPSTRPSSSSWPTWPPSSRRPGCWCRTRPRRIDAGVRADVEAGMAKLFASETALELATEAMRIHGGYGYTTELPGRALLPRRAADDHRRGHERDPAHRDRPGPAGPLLLKRARQVRSSAERSAPIRRRRSARPSPTYGCEETADLGAVVSDPAFWGGWREAVDLTRSRVRGLRG